MVYNGTPVLTHRMQTLIDTAERKGLTLLTEHGNDDTDSRYQMRPTQYTGIYELETPERTNPKTLQNYTVTYTVDVLGGTCNCIPFGLCNWCKHLVAAILKTEEEKQAYINAVAKAAVFLGGLLPVLSDTPQEARRIQIATAVPGLPQTVIKPGVMPQAQPPQSAVPLPQRYVSRGINGDLNPFKDFG